jgi:5-methylcytosine-specific restriction protein A
MTAKKPTPGEITTRAVMKEVFGGGPQGGIITSTTSSNVLIYTDHDTGAAFGYKDGWLDEEDELGRVFEYTGAGTEGHQTFLGRKGVGNKAILQHVEDGNALHLFMADGKVPGSGTKWQRYVGEFELDAEQPYVIRQALDKHKALRKVIVFRLRPVGVVHHDEHDDIPKADKTVAVPVPADVTTSSMVEPEARKTGSAQRSAVPKTQLERRESELAEAYEAFLKGRGREVKRFQIKPKGSTSTLLTDLYDATGHVLYESKGTARRDAVRMAIGQLLDYRRHVSPVEPHLAVLLPARPQEDLCDLLETEGIALVYRDGENFIGGPVQ